MTDPGPDTVTGQGSCCGDPGAHGQGQLSVLPFVRVRIIAGQGDFASLGDGEVLVAKVTTPAWTPLFTRAAAVVTDGGTLAAHAHWSPGNTAFQLSSVPAMPPRGCAPDSLSPSTAAPAPYDAPILADARPILTL